MFTPLKLVLMNLMDMRDSFSQFDNSLHIDPQAIPNLELPLIKEWLPLAHEISPTFSKEIVTSHVFIYCVIAEFHNYANRYQSETKTLLAAIKFIVKMSATCSILLT